MQSKRHSFWDVRGVFDHHVTHIPVLRQLVSDLRQIADKLSPKANVLPQFSRVNVNFSLYALRDLNESLVEALERDRVCSVEALSRVAIEKAVNLMYVVDDENDERAKSLLLHYLSISKRNAKSWLKHSLEKKRATAIEAGQKKLKALNYWVNRFGPANQFGNLSAWPNAADRFKAVGAESFYRTAFATASDAIHGFSEDIFNLTVFSSIKAEEQDEAFKAYFAEKRSFAVYLAATCLGLFLEALYRLAVKLQDVDSAEELLRMVSTVNSIIVQHDEDNRIMHTAIDEKILSAK
jgi:hypothetical protein